MLFDCFHRNTQYEKYIIIRRMFSANTPERTSKNECVEVD